MDKQAPPSLDDVAMAGWEKEVPRTSSVHTERVEQANFMDGAWNRRIGCGPISL